MHKIFAKTYLGVLISKGEVYIQSSEIVKYRVNMYFIHTLQCFFSFSFMVYIDL